MDPSERFSPSSGISKFGFIPLLSLLSIISLTIWVTIIAGVRNYKDDRPIEIGSGTYDISNIGFRRDGSSIVNIQMSTASNSETLDLVYPRGLVNFISEGSGSFRYDLNLKLGLNPMDQTMLNGLTHGQSSGNVVMTVDKDGRSFMEFSNSINKSRFIFSCGYNPRLYPSSDLDSDYIWVCDAATLDQGVRVISESEYFNGFITSITFFRKVTDSQIAGLP